MLLNIQNTPAAINMPEKVKKFTAAKMTPRVLSGLRACRNDYKGTSKSPAPVPRKNRHKQVNP